MRGRVVLGLTLALLAGLAGAAAGDPGSDGQAKQRIDARIDRLRGEIAGEPAARDRLVASRDAVASVQQVKEQALASAREDRRSYLAEVSGLEATSAALAERIRAAQASGGYQP